MALVVKDNDPSPGYISWTGLHIVYKGVDYTIQNGNTNKRFVYWKPSVSTTVLQTSDTVPQLGDDDLLVFLNKSGIHVTVPTSTVIEGSLIVEESILTNALAANAVTANKIASGAIEATHLSAGAVTADAIAAGAVGAGAIAAGAVLAEAIASGQVLADHIAAGQIESAHIAANQIQSNHIAAGQIEANHIASGAITAGKIASGAITAGKIAAGAINASNLFVDGVITGAKIAGSTITANKLNVSQLSAISSNIGTITAGILRNSGNNAGVLLSGTVPSGWGRYLNLVDSSKPFLKHEQLELSQDGNATFSGTVASTEFTADTARFKRAWFQSLADATRRCVIDGTAIQFGTTDTRYLATLQINEGIVPMAIWSGMTLRFDSKVVLRHSDAIELSSTGHQLKADPDGTGWMTTGTFRVSGDLFANTIRSSTHSTGIQFTSNGVRAIGGAVITDQVASFTHSTGIKLTDIGLELTGGRYIFGTWHSVPAGSTGGLHHQGGRIHIYAQDSAYWRVNSGSGMVFRSGGTSGPIRGYIFHGSSDYFGLRSADGNWRVRVYNGGVYLHGTVEVIGSLFKSSSQRWKKNVRAWAPDPRILLSLRPVEFDFVEERGGGHDYGFIAEEVPEVFATEGREAISFDRITTALVAGWQDHENRIAALELALKKLERV